MDVGVCKVCALCVGLVLLVGQTVSVCSPFVHVLNQVKSTHLRMISLCRTARAAG